MLLFEIVVAPVTMVCFRTIILGWVDYLGEHGHHLCFVVLVCPNFGNGGNPCSKVEVSFVDLV